MSGASTLCLHAKEGDQSKRIEKVLAVLTVEDGLDPDRHETHFVEGRQRGKEGSRSRSGIACTLAGGHGIHKRVDVRERRVAGRVDRAI